MALDRQDIEKKDFPIHRRGYEPEAVDAHLRALASEIEALKQQQQARPPTETLAAVASEQVRAIVEAAESSAAGIQRDAEEDASRTRQQAAEDAERSRSDAAVQAREHVARVSEATAVMLQRVDAMESELGALVESLRTGANRLTADLALLQGNMGDLRAAGTGGGAPPAPEPPPPVEEAPAPEPPVEVAEAPTTEIPGPPPEPQVEPVPPPEPEVAPPPPPEPEVAEAPPPAPPPEPELEPEPMPGPPPEAAEPAPEPPAATPIGAGDDTEGARLIALNMALNGTPREETDRYLAENFNLPDRQGLLDEVYARVG